MDKVATDSALTGFGMLALAVFLAILPIIIASSRTGKILELATAALCLTALVGTIGSFAFGIMGPLVVVPFLSALWMASLLCGLASCLNNAANRRANDMVFRLLYNEAENLDRPKNVSSIRRDPT